ncbi:hypothetical protein LUD75_09245 [Epilithonimonas sp. JDS]|uniref:hypothetical protein n=1 Tax=Epilithonimonas sp. JDS TaxID=2902797 RepID=UPI001E3FE057|nr:hypothetical protein [Epilithonimonas sp. JDS]MCD9854889.1 hypothetical protein [Epilithonimonas sp. JDS]
MKILLFISLLFAEVYQAQLFIINDKDGFTNVRQKADQNSKIIGKIMEGQAFAIDSFVEDEENKSKNWTAVQLPTNVDKNLTFIRFEGEEKTGYIHKSRLVELETLPKFEINEVNPNQVTHYYKDFEIEIETQVFRKSDHQITRSEKGHYIIDGKRAYPYYGGESPEIKSIKIKSKNQIFEIPKIAFKNLMMTNARNTTVYKGNNEELYIVFNAGDGADFYQIIFCIKSNQLISRTITSTIP